MKKNQNKSLYNQDVVKLEKSTELFLHAVAIGKGRSGVRKIGLKFHHSPRWVAFNADIHLAH